MSVSTPSISEDWPITFWVSGKARPKGSLQAHCLRDRKHTIVQREGVEGSKEWRQAVARAARAQLPDGWVSYAGPVAVRISCFFEREIGVGGEVMPSSAGTHPTAQRGFGDTDKLARNVNDALTDAGVISDDRYVVRIGIDKEFVAPGAPPGAQITVYLPEDGMI